jgi:hypothetical protein
MVKLSRTSLGFFVLTGLPALAVLATKGSGLLAGFLTGGDFLVMAARATGFFAVAAVASGLLRVAGEVAAGFLGRAAGLAAAGFWTLGAGLAAGVVAFVSAGFVSFSAMT